MKDDLKILRKNKNLIVQFCKDLDKIDEVLKDQIEIWNSLAINAIEKYNIERGKKDDLEQERDDKIHETR